MRSLTYYVAATLDGYIAGTDGGFDAFDVSEPVLAFIAEHFPETLPTPARAHLGVDAVNRRFDTVLMGRSTYQVGADQGLTSPYAHLRQVVFSSTISSSDSDVEICGGDPAAVVRRMKAEPGQGIWLCGGGILAGALIDEIDVLIIKRQPLVLGTGRPMFDGQHAPQRFDLVDRTSAGSLCVETHHARLP